MKRARLLFRAAGDYRIVALGKALNATGNCTYWSQMMETYETLPTSNGRVSSQGMQDGIVKVIFDRIGTRHKQFVEFGFGYAGNIDEQVMDSIGLNTRSLVKRGWHGVYFDAAVSAPEFNVVQAVLNQDNIGNYFKSKDVPYDVDYVSIDVASIDLWLLRGLLRFGYRPRVISVEYNSHFPPDVLITFQAEWHPWTERSVYGASAGSLRFVAELYGYDVIYIMTHLDIFFIRQDILNEFCETGSLLPYDSLSRHLPYKHKKPCKNDDLSRVVDLPLALEGNISAAQKKAVETMKTLGMCETIAFKNLSHGLDL